MGLSSALNLALTGLTANRSELDLIAGNIANADTVGYTRKTLNRISVDIEDRSIGVRLGGVQRHLDKSIQLQYWSELSGSGFTGTTLSYMERIDSLYGQPGGANSLDGIFNEFNAALTELTTSPADANIRGKVISKAEILAQRLNSMSDSIQSLRAETEVRIAEDIETVNNALDNIERLNVEIISGSAEGHEPAALLDSRDRYITVIADKMDIRVSTGQYNSVTIITNSGHSLFDGLASRINFNEASNVSAQSKWDADPAKSNLGTISLGSPSGLKVDLIANKAFRSGEIKSLIEMRDTVLVEAQEQLDELAHIMSLALSNYDENGTAVTVGAQNGFDIDLASLQSGNPVTINYTESGTTKTMTLIRVDDTTLLPLANNDTSNPADTVVGIDFSGGFAGAVTAIGTALGGNFTVSNPSATNLRVLDDGAANLVTIASASASITETSLTGGRSQIALFVDGGKNNAAYTDSFDGLRQRTGFAARIRVSPTLSADNTRLVISQTTPTTTLPGDNTRPLALVAALNDTSFTFSASTGLGSDASPISGTIEALTRRVISHQGSRFETAQILDKGQQVAVNSVRGRFEASSKVSIDEEMANLIRLQTAYSANARILTAVKEMIASLMRA